MMKIQNILTVAIFTTSLCGCGLYSKFESAKVDVPLDSLYSYIQATSDTTTIASMAWRELFLDAKLQKLIEQGIENNTNLNVAKLNVDKVQVALQRARLAYIPSLGVGASAGVNSFAGQLSKPYSLSLTSSWEIDLFGKLRNGKEQQKVALEQSRVYAQGVQTELVASIATLYYSLLMVDEQLEISKQTLKAWDENIRAMEALVEAGRLNNTSVLQSKSSRKELEASIITLEKAVAQDENNLSVLLLLPPQKIERGKMKDCKFPESLSVGVPMQLLSNRADVRAAEYNVAYHFYGTQQARASIYPSLTLNGVIGFNNGTGAVSSPSDMLYSLVASLVQPLFNRGVLKAQLEISKISQEEALLQFNQALLDGAAEVNNALIGWQSASKRLDIDNQRKKLQYEALQSAQLLMQHGNANYLEVLTAQMSFLQSNLVYTTDKFSQIAEVITLYRALGGGGV